MSTLIRPRHTSAAGACTISVVIARFVNMLGLPAIALPVGFDDRGLPAALQLIGRRGRDRDLIAFVAAIQKKSDWHGSVPDAIHDVIETDEGLCA